MASSARSRWRAARSPRERGRTRASSSAEITNVSASTANAQPAPRPSTSAVATAGPSSSLTFCTIDIAAFACCSSASGTVCGISPVAAGLKNASAVPNAASIATIAQIGTSPRKISSRQQSVQHGADHVGGDHHAVALEPVGPHAADQHEQDERDRVRRQHEPDVGRRADLGHVQRERDEDDRVAEAARARRQPQEPELTVAEDARACRP